MATHVELGSLGESLTEELFPNAVFGSAPRRHKNSNPKPKVDTSVPTLTRRITMQTTPPKVPSRSLTRPSSAAKRPDSPDLRTILANTPRPRRKSSASFSPASGGLHLRSRSTTNGLSRRSSIAEQSPDNVSVSDYGALLEEAEGVDTDEENRLGKVVEDGGSESDSSIDLHTPLPHLMFRDGLLSPRSRLFPQGSSPFALEDGDEDPDFDRARSVLSVVSTAGSLKTKLGFLRDPRDTNRRRNRHRDGRLLRAGMGLTTGLGWSDSEDEDAPSTLTRRLIQTSIARKPSPSLSSPTSSRRSSQVTRESTVSPLLSRSPPLQPSFLRKNPLVRSASTSFSWVRPEPDPSPPSSEPKTTRNRTQSSASVSTVSTVSQYSQTSSTASASTSSTPSVRRPMKLPKSTELQFDVARKRTESSASTSSLPHTSSASSGSPSSSTIVSGVPRALRLPQSTSMSNIRSRSNRSTSVSSTLVRQRTRTLSTSQAASSVPRPLKTALRAPAPAPAPLHVLDITDRSASVSPPPPSPSSPRARPLVAGPRPRPRTGTGMAYRTGSYPSLQGTAMRMRTMSMASSNDARVMI
ncbi:hypothetical protein BKA93DRAFT_387721 [Sparassis latifolia]